MATVSGVVRDAGEAVIEDAEDAGDEDARDEDAVVSEVDCPLLGEVVAPDEVEVTDMPVDPETNNLVTTPVMSAIVVCVVFNLRMP